MQWPLKLICIVQKLYIFVDTMFLKNDNISIICAVFIMTSITDYNGH